MRERQAVWILEELTDYEGAHFIAVFSSYGKAAKYRDSLIKAIKKQCIGNKATIDNYDITQIVVDDAKTFTTL